MIEQLVTVIIPTYGKPDFLERAIQSVMNQTYDNWELIVVDDNDPETEGRIGTEAIMEKYCANNKIKYIKHSHNKNGAAARNTGIEESKGDFICFLDSDDEYFPKRLERCVETMQKEKRSEFIGVYTGCEIRQPNGDIIRRRTQISSGNFIKETLAASFPLSSGSNLFIREDVVKEISGFDESFRRHQDYEFLVRVFRKYSLVALPEILLVKNEIGSNIPDVERMYTIKMQYLDKFKEDIKKLSHKEQNYIFAEHYLVLQAAAFRQKLYKYFIVYSARSFGRRPFYSILRTGKLFARTVLKRSGKVNS